MISPPGRGTLLYTQSAYITSLLLFALGAVVSAAAVGGVCGALGALFLTWAPSLHIAIWSLVAGVATIYGFAGLRGVKWPVPTRHWQVPSDWGQHGQPLFALAFGLILGAGFFTFITSIGYYLLLAICVVAADPVRGSMLMAMYGAARAAPVILTPLALWLGGQTYTFETAVQANEWFACINRRLVWLQAAVLFAVAGSAIAVGLGRI